MPKFGDLLLGMDGPPVWECATMESRSFAYSVAGLNERRQPDDAGAKASSNPRRIGESGGWFRHIHIARISWRRSLLRSMAVWNAAMRSMTRASAS
jgi:hypothetical protein